MPESQTTVGGPAHDAPPASGDARPAARQAVRQDARRLAVLRATGLLGAPAEEAFDRLTRLAVRLVGAPAAFVSLVDAERDVYVSTCGVPEPLASARALDGVREGETFCHFTIGRTTPLVLPDTGADPTYRHVPTVRTLGVAAYVGVPLVVAGEVVGAFCVIDHRPRAWTADEVELLTELAASAQREIELRCAAADAHVATARLATQTAATAAEHARATGILEGMREGYFALDRDYRVVAVNAATERGAGQRRADMLGRPVWEVFPGTVGTAYEHHFRRAVEEGLAGHFTHEYADARVALVAEEDVYPTAEGGAAVFWRDVTARVRAEAALRASEAKYRTLFEQADQGFGIAEILVDDAGRPCDYRMLEINPQFERLTGQSRERFLAGRTVREVAPELEEHWYAFYGDVGLTGVPAHAEIHAAAWDRWFQVSAYRVGEPAARHVAILFTEVTATRRAREERERLLAEAEAARGEAERARSEAEAASRAKSEFLAVMSHELRTPLNAIGGYAELLEMGIRGPMTAEQLGDLARIQQSQRHLLGLINEVLNYAKLESGAVRYAVTDVPVREALAAAEAMVAPQARAKGLRLTVGECRPGLQARADPDKLRQVLLNLLSNAVKFTDRGGAVTLACERVGGDATRDVAADIAADVPAEVARGVVAIRVRDTGGGIPADQLARIFEPFVQVRADLTRPHEGTGLGLAISRDLARGMGGDLTAESTAGAGSTFTLTLPVAR